MHEQIVMTLNSLRLRLSCLHISLRPFIPLRSLFSPVLSSPHPFNCPPTLNHPHTHPPTHICTHTQPLHLSRESMYGYRTLAGVCSFKWHSFIMGKVQISEYTFSCLCLDTAVLPFFFLFFCLVKSPSGDLSSSACICVWGSKRKRERDTHTTGCNVYWIA